MENIPKEAMPAILPVKPGRNSKLRMALLNLQVGDGLFLPRNEWKMKNPPYHVVAKIKKKFGYRYEYGFKTDGTGWLFRRVA